MSEPLSKRQIRNIMRAEQKSAGITKINPGLYRALIQYLQRMQNAYLEAHAESKTQKALTLTKDIRDTERDISTIYELRERKILLMAQDVVRGGAPSLNYLFPEEKLLLLRLSSILLAMRSDIRIDFHQRVDKYIKTIAKEYDLERRLFAPFHPTDPFCEDTTLGGALTGDNSNVGDDQSSSNDSGVATASDGRTGGNADHMNGREDHGTIDDPDLPGGRGIEIRKDIADQEVIERIETPSGELESMSMDGKDLRSDPKNTTTGNSGESGTTSIETATTGEMEGGEGSIGGSSGEMDDEEDDEEDEESSDYLNEYAIAGTLEPVKQFRGSDLHDYRFEAREIISLPKKMANLLEKQGKLFIIEMGKAQRSE
jgi:hypothetical protein